MLKFVGIGGGTGLSVLLRGLKQLSGSSTEGANGAQISLSAVVCVSDNGGSSGYLRQCFGIPAVGDLRNCLVALSDGDRMLADLFQYRFSSGSGLEGHSLGNLIVTALFQMSGTLGRATELAQDLLRSRGCILPVTESTVTLCAETDSGDVIRGESQISVAKNRIRKVWLEPDSPPPTIGVLHALSSVDAIVLGPGSLYTSTIPNLLVDGVAEAVRNSQALKIFVCNLMTQPGETDGFTAADHLHALETYLGAGAIDLCVLNSSPIEPFVEEKYLEARSEPVWRDENEIKRMGVVPAVGDLLLQDGVTVRHDSIKLARLIVSYTRGFQRARVILPGQEQLVA